MKNQFRLGDVIATVPVLFAYLRWDLHEVHRAQTTMSELALVTCLSIAVGLPLRFLHGRLCEPAAKFYARILIALAGILLALGWVGPSMLIGLSAKPAIVFGLSGFPSAIKLVIYYHSFLFVVLFFSLVLEREVQVALNTYFGVGLVVFPYIFLVIYEAWRNVDASSTEGSVVATDDEMAPTKSGV